MGIRCGWRRLTPMYCQVSVLTWRRLRPDYRRSRASSAKHGGILAGKTLRIRAYARRHLDTTDDGPRRRTHASLAVDAGPNPADRRRSFEMFVAVAARRGAFRADASSRPPPPPRTSMARLCRVARRRRARNNNNCYYQYYYHSCSFHNKWLPHTARKVTHLYPAVFTQIVRIWGITSAACQ